MRRRYEEMAKRQTPKLSDEIPPPHAAGQVWPCFAANTAFSPLDLYGHQAPRQRASAAETATCIERRDTPSCQISSRCVQCVLVSSGVFL